MTQMDIPLTPLHSKKRAQKRTQIGKPAALWPPILSGKISLEKRKMQTFPSQHMSGESYCMMWKKPHATIPPPSESDDLQMEMLHLLMHQNKLLEDQYTAAGKKDLFDQRSKDVRIQFHI